MGRSEAMSVPWAALKEAIRANPHRGVALARAGGAAATVAAIPETGAKVTWLGYPSVWTEDTTFSIADVVSLVLWIADPLYRSAAPSVRRIMEMEEATTLLHGIDANWRRLHGKGRGWVRKHLEEDLRERSAGADPAPDAWELIRSKKRAAQLADYVCLCKGVRAALWWPDQKVCTTVPLTGPPASAGVVQLNCESGRILLNGTGDYRVAAATWPAVLSAAAEMSWAPPLCAPAIGAQTVAQIQEKMDALEKGLPRTGGRTGMWNRYLWTLLSHELNGVPAALLLEDSISSADSAP
jgi:hypothetical protein